MNNLLDEGEIKKIRKPSKIRAYIVKVAMALTMMPKKMIFPIVALSVTGLISFISWTIELYKSNILAAIVVTILSLLYIFSAQINKLFKRKKKALAYHHDQTETTNILND